MKFKRSSGVLLHPTSLAGRFGIGDMGPEAMRWLDFLAQAGCSLWQVLPLGPTGYGDSPYQCFSAFAGNPYLISPQSLLDEGLLHLDDLVDIPTFPTDRVDFGRVISWKLKVLDRAYVHFQQTARAPIREALNSFRTANSAWLEDFALFMALKEIHDGAAWFTWEADLRDRDETALKNARTKLKEAIDRQIFRQFLFFRQWEAVRAAAQSKGIQIIGDIPIFVAHDSADVWAHPELFFLDEMGKPTVVAGVPPDYFSPTGQLWGNPLYRWEAHRQSGYAWWIDRMRAGLNQVDLIRLDHFRGFVGFWEIPGSAETAEKGRWVSAPGKDLFNSLQSALGELPIIAEDLGVITADVVALREQFQFPGMKIFQFGFAGGPKDAFLPHNYPENCVVYTGTHDNDTAKGWYERVPEAEKDFYRRYLSRDGSDISWDLIRGIWSSVANQALCPMQDLLSLGNEARMNYPGNPSGNWSWRMDPGALTAELREKVYEINYLYDRLNPVMEAIKKPKEGRHTAAVDPL
jgi:4-alpha-glucanotransferase